MSGGRIADALRGRTAVLDGELVVGVGSAADSCTPGPRLALRPSRAGSGCRVTSVAFDVLHLDGKDVCRRPYLESRALAQVEGRLPEGWGRSINGAGRAGSGTGPAAR